LNGNIDLRIGFWYFFFENVMADTMEAAITAKGQATIPKAIHSHLGVKPCDRIKFFVHPDGSVVLLPKRPVSQLRGIGKARRRPITIADMTEAAAEGAAAGAPRRKRR
jgi:AbrB family looped-hinge helix DNA binding protein